MFQTYRLMEQIKKEQQPKGDREYKPVRSLCTGLLLVDGNDLGCRRTPLTVYTDMIPRLEMH